MILAKRHGLDVTLYLQPQRAAFLRFSVPLWWGVGVSAPAPRGMSGGVQVATLHHTGALTALRHAAQPQKARSLEEPLTHDPREPYEPTCQLPRHLVTTSVLAPTTGSGFVTPVVPTAKPALSLAAGHGPQGFSPSRPSRSAVASGQP